MIYIYIYIHVYIYTYMYTHTRILLHMIDTYMMGCYPVGYICTCCTAGVLKLIQLSNFMSIAVSKSYLKILEYSISRRLMEQFLAVNTANFVVEDDPNPHNCWSISHLCSIISGLFGDIMKHNGVPKHRSSSLKQVCDDACETSL